MIPLVVWPQAVSNEMQQHGGAPARGRIHWRQVGLMYRRELRAALRERAIVINTILIPLFLYPFMLWAGLNGLLFVMSLTEGKQSRVEVRDWPAQHPGLQRAFQRENKLTLIESTGGIASAETAVRQGRLDAVVQFLPPTGTNALVPGNFETRISFNGSKERSLSARDRIRDVIGQYRFKWLEREAESRGINAADWEWFRVQPDNVASARQVGHYLLGMMLPVFFLVMVAMACIYPAVDATAGERERNTWETLMSTGTNLISIATAKYLYVMTLGGLAGLLNLFAVWVTAKPILAPLLEKAGSHVTFTVSPAALPWLALSAVLLSGFVAAGMLLFASFARTFKEGQAMVVPFYLMILLPVVFMLTPGGEFPLWSGLVPVANVTLLVRHAVTGTLGWAQAAITVTVSLACIAAALRLAAFILTLEDFRLGTGGGFKLLAKRVFKRRNASPPRPHSSP